jgi:type IV secretory pathway VirB10-like protein
VTGNVPNESAAPEPVQPTSSADRTQAFRLRPDYPRITRLSRKVLAGGSALASLVVAGAVLWALKGNHPRNPAPEELYSTDHHNVADGLTTLPQDYAGVPRDVPRLGPPLPATLGASCRQERNPDRSALTPNNSGLLRKARPR